MERENVSLDSNPGRFDSRRYCKTWYWACNHWLWDLRLCLQSFHLYIICCHNLSYLFFSYLLLLSNILSIKTFKISFLKMIFHLCINPLKKNENIPHNVTLFVYFSRSARSHHNLGYNSLTDLFHQYGETKQRFGRWPLHH